MDKKNLRAVFSKSGRAVFISHLDLMRTMQRAFNRSCVPVWYTQGFNPHIYINFPLALSLGVKSSCELMDFAVVEDIPYDDIKHSLNSVMPEGIEIISVVEPVYENKDVGFCEYIFDFYYDDVNILMNKFNDFTLLDTIEVKKHSKKKGEITVDIKPYIDIISADIEDGFLRLNLRLPASQVMSINSNVFIEAFTSFGECKFDRVCVERTKILCNNGAIFV